MTILLFPLVNHIPLIPPRAPLMLTLMISTLPPSSLNYVASNYPISPVLFPVYRIHDNLPRSYVLSIAFAHNVIATYATIRCIEVLLQNHLPPRGHVDGGAMTSCMDRLEYLWSYHACTPTDCKLLPELTVADGTKHCPFGYGYLKIPIRGYPQYLFICTYYVPQIPATILSPDCMGKALRCRGYHTY